jgi:hypothetical protein
MSETNTNSDLKEIKDVKEVKNKHMLNLDITTIIACVSDITNDPDIATRFGNISEWKIKNPSVYQQILDEIENPLLPKLNILFNNKTLVVTKKAIDKTLEIIEALGSTQEKNRLQLFLKKLTVIPDDPSQEFIKLKSKNWSEYNKSIFGTSHKLDIPVVTGNLSLVSIILNDLEIDVLDVKPHRARCFVGEKYTT